MPPLAPQRAAALYCRPTLDDPGCKQHRRDLLAYAGRVGHVAHSVHQEEHAEAVAAILTRARLAA